MNTLDTVRFLAGMGAVPDAKMRQEMERGSSIYPDASEIPDVPYPANDSVQAQRELEHVAKMARSGADLALAVQADRDMGEPFRDYLSERLPGEDQSHVIDEVLRESSPLVMALKYRYMRPRPMQLAYMYGMKLRPKAKSVVQASPSYPSGHAMQSYLIAHRLADLYPSHKRALLDIARRIALSRITLGVHFLSDVEYGKRIAELVHGGVR
jgi:acid phosphatase (class A)